MKKTVLVIDDDAGLLDSVQQVLKEKGYNVCVAVDAKGIDTYLNECKADMILLDIRMNRPNGERVARRLKSYKDTKTIPIVFISGDEKIEEKTKMIGVEGFIKKPFRIEQLIKTVEQFVPLSQ